MVLAACGGSQATPQLPDESRDLNLRTESASAWSRAGTTPAMAEIGGTQWRWVEAHCTEGPLDLEERGFQQLVRVVADSQGLLLTYDQFFEDDRCTQTVIQRARPTPHAGQYTMVEEVRVAHPATEACQGRMEDERPGEIRHSGEFLEVFVQRSHVWCNGLEVRMVYAPAQATPLSADQIARRYVAQFNRRDAAAIAALFSDAGSLVEPFNVTATGGSSRHTGTAAVQQWYEEAFSGVDWLALKLLGLERGRQQGHFVTEWQYMDPRLDEPMRGRNYFTIAVGEIYETRIELADGEEGAEVEAEQASNDASPRSAAP